MRKFYASMLLVVLFLTGCSENYSNGERIGLVTQFSKSGLIWKSWEGHLNLTQTGMNSSSNVPFDFSIDNDKEELYGNVIKTIDSAANLGWKIKLVYHETKGFNWFSNRGETNHFITSIDVLDRNPVGNIFNTHGSSSVTQSTGHSDTIYVVIVPKERLKY